MKNAVECTNCQTPIPLDAKIVEAFLKKMGKKMFGSGELVVRGSEKEEVNTLYYPVTCPGCKTEYDFVLKPAR